METLKISKTSDESHRRISSLFYGVPKIGKTSLTKTIETDEDSRIFYISADPGQLVLRDREFTIVEPSNGIRSREFFDDVYSYLAKNGENFDWVVVDGVDEIAEAILADAMARNKDGRKAYGEMADYTEKFMKSIRDLSGMSTIFITHIQDIGTDGESRFVPMFCGKQLREKVNAWFDLIGCMRFVQNENGKTERVIQFSPEVDTRFMVGDRSGALDAYEPPDLKHIFNKIHSAGYETKGSFKPLVVRTDAEIAELVAYCKDKFDMTPSEIMTYSNNSFGKSPRNLTLEQFEIMKKELKEINK